MPLYLEDLSAGQQFVTPSRTITEADLNAFAEVSGDHNPIHADTEVAAANIYGQQVVHGLLGLSAATGLLYELGIFVGTTIAILGIDNWRFRAPMFVNDTIRLELTIMAVRSSRSPGRGIVERHFRILDEGDRVLQEGDITLMIKTRDVAPAA